MVLAVTSLAFPKLTAQEMITQMKQNGLTAIEWCDCHLPVGDLSAAEQLKSLMDGTGLCTLSYRVSQNFLTISPDGFQEILKTAQALNADTVTLFCAKHETEKTFSDELPSLISQAQILADLAEKEGISLCFTCNGDSLFHDYPDITDFVNSVSRSNVFINWQPNQTSSLIYNIFELKMLSPFVHHVYVALCESSEEQPPLIEGQDEWQQYLKVLKNVAAKYLLLKNPKTEDFPNDCGLMQTWIDKVFAVET